MPKQQHDFRVGIFDSVSAADRAVENLRTAGYAEREIGILCSEKYKDHFFPSLRRAHLPEEQPQHPIATGGLLGATIGGMTMVATTLVTGGVSLLAAPVLLGGGAIAGSFAGAMSTVYDNDEQNHYDQAIEKGKILVVVEVHGENKEQRLNRAETILSYRAEDAGMPVVN